MMKVELAARNMPSCLIQVEGFVMRLWLYQDSGVHRLVLVYAISICNGIADIDFAEKDAPGTLLEHTKSATGNAEVRIVIAVQEALRHISPVVHLAAFIITIEKRETSIAKRFDDIAQHTLQRATWNDVLATFVLHELRGLFGIRSDVTWVRDEDGRFSEYINIHVT